MAVKKFLFILALILFSPLSAQALDEEICLEFDNNFQRLTINDSVHANPDVLSDDRSDSLVDGENLETRENLLFEDEKLLEEAPPIWENVPTLKDANIVEQENRFFRGLTSQVDRLYNLKIEQTNTASSLFKEPLTKHFQSGPLETFHPWAVVGMNMESNFEEGGHSYNKFNPSMVNVILDGQFKGGKENFRILLDASHQHSRPFMKQFVQDFYVESKRIPHHTILVGRSRTGIGYEGIQSPYTLPLLNRSQISRNFGNIRKNGVRVIGNYSLVDYDIGGYSSDTFFTEFLPGMEFDGWVNFKPLAKTNGKYGKLTTGGGIITGRRNSVDYFISGVFIGYEYKKFWTRMEYSSANGSNGLTGLTSKHREGWYITLGYKITKKIEAVLRYDEFDPDKSCRHDHRREYTAGVNYYLKGQALKLVMNYIFCQNDNKSNSHRILLGAQIAI